MGRTAPYDPSLLDFVVITEQLLVYGLEFCRTADFFERDGVKLSGTVTRVQDDGSTVYFGRYVSCREEHYTDVKFLNELQRLYLFEKKARLPVNLEQLNAVRPVWHQSHNIH